MKNVKSNVREREVDLALLFQSLIKHAWAIILVGAIAGLVTLLATIRFVTPLYTASVTMYVNNNNSTDSKTTISYSDLSASIMLTDTYLTIIESDLVLQEVIDNTGVDYSIEQLKGMITGGTVSNTEVLTFDVESEDPKEAAMIANELSDVVVTSLPQIVEGSSVKQLDNAEIPERRTSPNLVTRVEIGFLAGMFFMILIFSILFLLDNGVKSANDLENLGYPILGSIPDMGKSYKKAYGYGYGYSKKVGQ